MKTTKTIKVGGKTVVMNLGAGNGGGIRRGVAAPNMARTMGTPTYQPPLRK